jgi:hypothetical protein
LGGPNPEGGLIRLAFFINNLFPNKSPFGGFRGHLKKDKLSGVPERNLSKQVIV